MPIPLLRRRLPSFALFSALTMTTVSASAADLLIEDVSVISPERSAPLPHQWVHIRQGRIVEISNKSLRVPTTTPRLNGAGKYLTPGLMDSHVHLSVPAGLPSGVDSPALNKLAADYHRQQPRSYLYFGVTQVLELLGSEEGLQAFDAQPQKPDRFRCGAAPVLHGYPNVVTDGESYGITPEFIIEPENKTPLPPGIDPAEHTPEKVVARIAASGARCVKVFIENGFGDASHLPLLKPATLARVRRATHAAGMKLLAHANAYDMQQIAVAAEVDVIAHGLWNWGALSKQPVPGVPAEIATLMKALRAQNIGYQPTLRVIAGMRELFLPETLNDPILTRVTPPSLLAFYRSKPGLFFKEELLSEFEGAPDSVAAATFLRISQQGARVAKHLHDSAYPLLLGSDTPGAPLYANQPGYNTYLELRAMVDAGIPLDAVLRAGTLNNAKQFGLERDYGSVAKGKIANLLLLTANPLQTADAWNQIETVILHGDAIARESLAVANAKP